MFTTFKSKIHCDNDIIIPLTKSNASNKEESVELKSLQLSSIYKKMLLGFLLCITTIYVLLNKIQVMEHMSLDSRSIDIEEQINSLLDAPLCLQTLMKKLGSLDKWNDQGRNQTDEDNQGIAVSYPYVPDPSYGEPVYSTLLVNHTFANSWGEPSLNSFTPPEGIKFNKVVLTLNTSVDYVQYDRLAHLFVGGAEIWRTSTIEPSNIRRFSSFKKDVSIYLKLFQQETNILFELENVVTSSLKGAFDTQLYADFYYSENPVIGGDDESGVQDAYDFGIGYEIFSTAKAADAIHPLISTSASNPPLKNLPGDKFEVTLPKIPLNTTRLRLSVFTSGNGNEEFWYTGSLDAFFNDYPDSGTASHGPARFINVYFNDQKIISQTPHPVIFTGGISPSFWIPTVSNNAFDLKSYDLDVSGLLPYLWENTSTNSSSSTLRIEISNGLDEFDQGNAGVLLDWITSANLLTFENENVIGSSGNISHIGQNDMGNSIGMGQVQNGSYQQILNANLGAELTSNLKFQLKDGCELNTIFSYHTQGLISNVQTFQGNGSLQNVTHVGHSHKSLLITDISLSNGLLSANKIFELNTTNSFPLLITTSTLDSNASDSTYQFNIINIKDTSVTVNGNQALEASAVQNGTSKFTISLKGNSGYGELNTKYDLQISPPVGLDKYSRVVFGSSKDGVISDKVYDNSADGFVSIDEFELNDTGNYQETKQFIIESYHNQFGEYLDPIFDVLDDVNIGSSLPNSHTP